MFELIAAHYAVHNIWKFIYYPNLRSYDLCIDTFLDSVLKEGAFNLVKDNGIISRMLLCFSHPSQHD